MNLTNSPTLITAAFANAAGSSYRNTIPATTSTPGAASMSVGFPPECFQPIASGGVAPGGADFNGILYAQSLALQWEQAGGNYPFSATLATAIGGYPKGAIVLRADGKGQWLNTTDANSTDPDGSSAAGWIALRANTGATTIAVVAGNNTPTLSQLGAQVLLITGSIASAANLILPLTPGANWLVVNNTTGAGALNVQGATGAVTTIAQGIGQLVYTDGVGYYSTSASVAGQYLPINGTAVAATKLATARSFNLSGPVTWTAQNFDGTANVSFTSAIAANALSIAMTSGLQPALDAKANLAGATFTGNVNISGASLNVTRAAADYNAIALTNTGGVQVQLNANGNSEGNVRTVTNHPLTFAVYNTTRLTLDTSGNATFTGSVTATGGFQVSDRRAKTNIAQRAVDTTLAGKLAPLWSQWNLKSDGRFDTALIAQDVLLHAPQFVQVPDDPDAMLSIDKAGIALECALGAELRINQLLARIEALEKTA